MNFKLAAFMDETIARFLLNAISFLPPYPKQIQLDADFKNLLVMKFWGIGSILESTPFLRALKRRYPSVPIDILTFSENKQLVEGLGLFRNVYTIDLSKGVFSLFFQTTRFILAHRKKYSLVIDLEFFANFSSLVTKLLASKYSLGFESFFTARNRCYSRTVIFDHVNHIRIIFLKFLNALNIERPADITLSIPQIPKEKKISVIEKFPALNDGHLQIAININASELCINRRWPEENFRKLINFMQQDYVDLQIYLTGGGQDLPLVMSFYESLSNKKGIHIACGKLDILEFCYALSKMTCLITSDSGPLHIAEAIRIPVVCFFGPETPALYGPMLDKSTVFYKNIYCSPCLNSYNRKKTKCKDNQCLKLISAENVYSDIKTKFFS